MTTTTVQPVAGTAAPKNVIARFIGVVTAPRATFESVVAHPKWFGMLALTAVIIAFCAALPMTTEAGKQAALDQQVRQIESFGVQVNDQMYEGMQRGLNRLPYTTAISVVVVSPIIVAIMAGILYAIFNAAMGGTATYKQVLTVVVHAGVISAVGQMFTGPFNFLRGAMTSATNLAVLLPMFPEGSFIARLAGTIDLFIIWWLCVLAIGLAVLYRRRTQSIVITLFSIYAVIAICIAVVMSRFGGVR